MTLPGFDAYPDPAPAKTYADGLRRAAVYAQDYLHDADVRKLQQVLYRFAAIDECAACDSSGVLRANNLERGVDHHPLAPLEEL